MAAIDNFIAGQASFELNGQSMLLVGEFAYRPAGNTVATLKGMDGIHGAKGSPQAAMFKAKCRDNGSVSIVTLSANTAASFVCQLANGKVISGNNFWRTGEPIEVDTEEAVFELEFEGADLSEN